MPVRVMEPKEELQRLLEEVQKQLRGLEAKLKQLDAAADSLEEAKKLIRAQMPSGSEVLSESEISDGKPRTITATGETLKEAFSKGRTLVPTGANIVRETALQTPGQRIITIEAFDEKEAREKAGQATERDERVQQCRLIKPVRSGFWGLGRKPGRYEVSLFQRVARIEIVVKPSASVRASVGEKRIVEEVIRLRRKAMELELTLLRSGAPESRASSSPISC